MAVQVSDALRDALERLDQAIDRLDARVSSDGESPADSILVERLDRMIARIELALAD